MKVKECRESICKDMNKLRRTGDVELVRQVVDLVINFGKSSIEDETVERWFLLRNIMDDDLTAQGLKWLNDFYQGMKQAEEKREQGRFLNA